MRAPYRGEQEALRAQADALRRELAAAREGSAELLRVQAELERELADLERAQLGVLGRGRIGRRIRARAAGLGAVVALAVATATIAVSTYVSAPSDRTAAGSSGQTAEAWFASVRARCNPVEVRGAVRREPAPGGAIGQGYLAACYALAHRVDDARRVLDRLAAWDRPLAATMVFDAVHPVADEGDEVAAGPVMELVLEYTPDNFKAVYHAGMAAYATGRADDSRRHLERFLGMYLVDDEWRRNAVEVLERLRPTPAPIVPYPPLGGPPETPSRSDVLIAMQSVSQDVRDCSDEHGVVNVRVEFAGRTGRAADVLVTSPGELPAATAVCIGRVVRAARVPPFGNATFSVSFPYRL